MSTTTTNLSLPLFEGTDNVDLLTVYNAAITALDTAVHSLQTTVQAQGESISTLESTVSSQGDALTALGELTPTAKLTVADLAKASVTEQQIVTNKEFSPEV